MLLNDSVGFDIHRIHCRVIGLEVCTDDWECQIAKKFGELRGVASDRYTFENHPSC
jgi:hypothetical protein